MKPLIVILGLSLCAAAITCSSKEHSLPQEKGDSPGQPHAAQTGASASVRGNMIKFVKHEVLDRTGTGLTVSTYLLPEDWTVKDSFYWEYRDVFTPVRYAGHFQSGDGSLKIEAFPEVAATWGTSPAGTTGIRPPTSVVEGLKQFIRLTRKVAHLRFTGQKVIPGTGDQSSQQAGSASETSSQSGIVDVEYDENGQPVEEEFYANLSVVRVVTQGTVYIESIIWTMTDLASCTAPKGRLEDCRKVALTLRSSARLTLPFYNRLVQVQKLLQDQAYARIYQAGQISRIISQTNDQISRTISESYWNTQKVNDHVNQQFSDYIRGVDRYTDNSGTEWQLPSGYANAWMNNKGEYLLSDQAGFDPNVALKEEWRPLQKH